MRQKEFNLSEKIMNQYCDEEEQALFMLDVKKFIRLLKKNLLKYISDWDRFDYTPEEVIDKLAGDKLK